MKITKYLQMRKFNEFFQKLAVLPAWLILYKLGKKFLPKHHPFNVRSITLQEWSRKATDLVYFYAAMFWFWIVGLVLFIIYSPEKLQ